MQRNFEKNLNLFEPVIIKGDLDRKNIEYLIKKSSPSIKETVVDIFLKMKQRGVYENGSLKKSVIVYSLYRNQCSEIEGIIKGLLIKENDTTTKTFVYHSHVEAKEKDEIIKQWRTEINSIVVATIAFGMGIDKPTVGLVAMTGLPSGIYEFLQLSGRAGRNGLVALFILYWKEKDKLNILKNVLEKSDFSSLKRLYALEKILRSVICIRNQLIESMEGTIVIDNCENCSNCVSEKSLVFTDVREIVDGILKVINFSTNSKKNTVSFIKDLLSGCGNNLLLGGEKKKTVSKALKFAKENSNNPFFNWLLFQYDGGENFPISSKRTKRKKEMRKGKKASKDLIVKVIHELVFKEILFEKIHEYFSGRLGKNIIYIYFVKNEYLETNYIENCLNEFKKFRIRKRVPAKKKRQKIFN